MSVPEKDKQIIRDLAKRVAEIASSPVHKEKIDMWMRLNRLERVRPLIHVQAIAASIWVELIPDDQLQTTDPFCRIHEMGLRKKIYCWQHIPDDRVVDDVVVCPLAIRGNSMCTAVWLDHNGTISSDSSGIFDSPEGLNVERPDLDFGAYAIKATINQESDIDKIQTDPHIWIDWEETERRYEYLCDLYDGILRVERRGPDFIWFMIMDTLSTRYIPAIRPRI